MLIITIIIQIVNASHMFILYVKYFFLDSDLLPAILLADDTSVFIERFSYTQIIH